MKVDLSLRGMRDYYPPFYSELNHIFLAWRETALSYGFEEFDGPMLETLELYKIKSGEEIVRQLYTFTDRGGREVALRPELTPSLARMIAHIQKEASKPIKWFSIPRCMRYEKPQKGRTREFFQFNVDVIGEKEGLADLEIMSVAIDSLIRLGLTERDFVVKVNHREFVSDYFMHNGIDEEKSKALYKIIDNARKATQENTLGEIEKLGLTKRQGETLMNYLSLTTVEDLKQLKDMSWGVSSLIELFTLIDAVGLKPYVELDPTIVRGLDYYTGIVFEIFDRNETMRSICGGGRYNNLLKEIAGVEIPATGFGMGDVVLREVLLERGLFPMYRKKVDYFLIYLTDKELPLMLKVARSLRKRGKSVEYLYRAVSVKKQMSRASRLDVKSVLIFGADELAEGKVLHKDMSTGEESKIEIDKLLNEKPS